MFVVGRIFCVMVCHHLMEYNIGAYIIWWQFTYWSSSWNWWQLMSGPYERATHQLMFGKRHCHHWLFRIVRILVMILLVLVMHWWMIMQLPFHWILAMIGDQWFRHKHRLIHIMHCRLFPILSHPFLIHPQQIVQFWKAATRFHWIVIW